LRGKARADYRAACRRGRGAVIVRQGPTTICARPLLEQELKLQRLIDGSDERTKEVADAIVYLRSQFCRTTDDALLADSQQHVTENCHQFSGLFRGELVFWGECYE
jgi:hypothetical protein